MSDSLTNGISVKVEPYHKGGGIDAYVMLADGCDGVTIYIKIALLSHTDQVLGISFHHSTK